jgi:hypothetical protein
VSVGKRRRKAAQRIAAEEERNRHRKFSAKFKLCLNGCGEPGPHFVPPSFGDPGFFMCTPKEESNDLGDPGNDPG